MSAAPWTMRLVRGDALSLLRKVKPASVDAIITDPPYSSGGLMRSDRANQATRSKYLRGSKAASTYTEFSGDNRDQRSWIMWSSLWISLALRALKPGGYILTFSDWRQLPASTDALQAGGAVWRGILSWDKTLSARAPHRGYFRHQCEFIPWGTRGALPVPIHERPGLGPWPGSFRHPVSRRKQHVTEKPVELLEELCRVAPSGGVILDPFMGSGTTGLAAIRTGRRFLGMEMVPAIFDLAARRLLEVEESQSRPAAASPSVHLVPELPTLAAAAA